MATVLVSIVYFVDILWRSSRKPFWFDELFTVYLCRLPTMRQTWIAVQHGADFNPPLFYILTRASQAVFGFSNIATRLPETLGVWLFCFCLFIFIARRNGRVAGFIGAVFPLLTLIQYYAYEARPHGITLGWCGLALLCWQRIVEDNAKWIWHLGFIAAMLGSVMTHVYAVYLFIPFALLEAHSLLSSRRVHWSIIAGMAVAAGAALPIYLPLMHTYRSMMPAAGLPFGVRHGLLRFATDSLRGSVTVVLLVLALSAFSLAIKQNREFPPQRVQLRKHLDPVLILAVGFLCIPLFGILSARFTHVGFFHRYFLSSLTGVSILLSEAIHQWGSHSRRTLLIMTVTAVMLLANLYTIGFNAWRGREDGLIEPSSKLLFFVYPKNALAQDVKEFEIQPDLPILDISGPTYVYLYHYASKDVVNRLYFGASSQEDLFLTSYKNLAKWGDIPLKLTDVAQFLNDHQHFYTYESSDPLINECASCRNIFVARGYALVSRKLSPDGAISEYHR